MVVSHFVSLIRRKLTKNTTKNSKYAVKDTFVVSSAACSESRGGAVRRQRLVSFTLKSNEQTK